MTADLLPCPFCGAAEPRKFISNDEFGRTSHGIQCTFGDCWICGPECGTEAEAIAAWNRRALPAVVPGVKARIVPIHTQSLYGVCIGGRWDGWVMVRHPDGHWVSHNKPDAIDPMGDVIGILSALTHHVNETPKSEHDREDVLTPAQPDDAVKAREAALREAAAEIKKWWDVARDYREPDELILALLTKEAQR